jgi:phage-related protein
MELFRLLGKIAVENAEARKALKEVSQEGQETESKLGKAFAAIGNGAVKMGKIIGAGMIAGAGAVAGLVTKSVQSYAEYEQLVGGVDTLFKESSAKVQEYAANAYQTAGMSANQYMETVTSFSASLLQSLDGDTAAAAEKANMAITDMSDNANKMGTDIGMIQNAYNGFAKQNYTMLDNLKLGYGGTKEEMQRLLEDAQKISGIKYDITSFADITDAIHVMQVEMGMSGYSAEELKGKLSNMSLSADEIKTVAKDMGVSYHEVMRKMNEGTLTVKDAQSLLGTTAREAATTISGSLSSMKGAWSNLLTAMSTDELPFDEYVTKFVDSVSTVAENIMPRVQQALQGVVSLVDQLAPIIIGKIPELVSTLLPSIVGAATGLVQSLVSVLPEVISAIQTMLPQIIDGFVQIFVGLVDAIIAATPLVIDAFVGVVNALVEALPQLIQSLVSALPALIPALIDGIVSMITTLCANLGAIILPLISALPDIVISIVEALVANLPILIEGFVSLFMGIVQALPQIIQALIDAIPTIITMLIDAITTNLPMLIDGCVQLIVALGQALPQIIESLVEALPGVISMLIDALVQNLPIIIDGLIRMVLAIVYALPQIIQELVAAIPVIISLLIEATIKLLPTIIIGLVQVVLGIVAALPGIFASLVAAIPGALEGVWEGIKNLFSGLGEWFGDIFSGAKDWALNAWSDAKEKWSNIKDKVSEGFSNLKDKVGEHFRKSKENAEKAWEKTKETWNKVKDKVSDAFSNLKDKLKERFQKAKENSEKAWEKTKEVWGKIKDKVSDAFSNLKDKLKEKFTKAKENSEAAWSKAKDAWSKISDKVSDGFSGLGNKLKEKFKGALETAKKGFSNALSIGKDLVKGIWNGISGAYDWIKKKIKKWVGNVTKFIKKLFGIKSPSTVMRDQVGKFLAEGVAVGIDENTSEVEKASEEMAKKVLDAAQKRLDDYKIYNNLALSEEVAYWDKVRQQIEEGTDARISADQKYLEAKKSLDDQILTAEEGLQSELDAIAQRIIDRQNELMGTYDLFEGFDFKAKEEERGYDNQDALLLNLAAQIETMEEYAEMMDGLEARIGGTALFDYLKTLDMKSGDNIQAVARMTDEQLQAYAKRYDEKVALAKRMAEEELAPQMMEDSQKAFDNFVSSCGDLGVEITSTLADYMATAEGTVMKSLAAISSAFSTFQLGALNMDAVISAPTLSDATVYTLNASAVGNTATEGTKASGTMSDVFASIVEQKNMMQKLIEMLSKFFPELIEAFDVDIFINGSVLAAELAPDMDAALGRISGNRERGR